MENSGPIMKPMMFVPVRVREAKEYLICEESPGLKAFRRQIPPFIHVEVVQQGTPEYDDLKTHSVIFEGGTNFSTHVDDYIAYLINDQMGQSTKEFYVPGALNAITPDSNERKLGIPLLKAMIAEMSEIQDSDYLEGVTKVYVIHPPQLEDELCSHLSALPVPAISGSVSARLISVRVGNESRHFVVEPYKMDLTKRHSADPRWLIVHLYNPDMPAMAIRVEAEGPLTFREPTPLLSDTEVAERWTMKVVEDYLSNMGVDIACPCHEPNGPKTFPDYRAQLNGATWNFEITRVLGNMLETRRVLDKPRHPRKMMSRAVQSPPIEQGDTEVALNHAIKSKERKCEVGEGSTNFCLVLLNALDLDIGRQSNVWEGIDLASFDAIILVGEYSQPSIEFLKGRSLMT